MIKELAIVTQDILKRGATEIWEDNASYMMSENPTNRDRSRHVDVKVHFLRDLVRDGHIKLVKCAHTVHQHAMLQHVQPASTISFMDAPTSDCAHHRALLRSRHT